jgi:hypothetical protein
MTLKELAATNTLSMRPKGVPEVVQKEAYNRIQALRERLNAPSHFSMEVFEALDEAVNKLRLDTVGDAGNRKILNELV